MFLLLNCPFGESLILEVNKEKSIDMQTDLTHNHFITNMWKADLSSVHTLNSLVYAHPENTSVFHTLFDAWESFVSQEYKLSRNKFRG